MLGIAEYITHNGPPNIVLDGKTRIVFRLLQSQESTRDVNNTLFWRCIKPNSGRCSDAQPPGQDAASYLHHPAIICSPFPFLGRDADIPVVCRRQQALSINDFNLCQALYPRIIDLCLLPVHAWKGECMKTRGQGGWHIPPTLGTPHAERRRRQYTKQKISRGMTCSASCVCASSSPGPQKYTKIGMVQ